MADRKVLLETTIQIHRIADDLSVRNALNGELVGKDIYTTSFVLREFLRTIMADLAYVHASAGKLGTDGDGRLALQRLVRVLANGESRFSQRAARREQYVIAAILDRFAYTRISLRELLCYLEYVAKRWIREFHRVPLTNGGTFQIAGEFYLTGTDDRPTEVHDWIRACNPIPRPPGFPPGAGRFLEEHRLSVVAAFDAMACCEARRRDDRLLSVLGRLRNKNGDFDFVGLLRANLRGNWCLGDLLISLETPTDVEIYTEDRHFEVLCGALKKKLYDGIRVRQMRH